MPLIVGGLPLEFDAQINTSDFAAALQEIESQVQNLTQKIQTESAKQGQALKDVLQPQTSLSDTANPELERTNKIISAYAELRRLKSQLARGDISDEAFSKTLEAAVELEHRLRNVNTEITLASSNTGGIKALGEGVRGLVGGFEALSGIMGLVSSDDEQIKKTTQAIIQSMGIINGIEELSAVLNKNSATNVLLKKVFTQQTTVAIGEQAVATEGLAVAEGLQTAATEGATVATNSLTAAMAANPVGVLLIAITALVAGIEILSSNTASATDEQLALNKALKDANDTLSKLITLYNEHFQKASTLAENAVALAEKQGKSESEIYQLRQKALDAKRLENIAILANLGYTGDITKEINKQIEFKKVELEIALENLKAEQSRLDIDKKQVELLQSKIDLLKGDYDAAKAALDAINSIDAQKTQEKAARAKQLHDEAIKSATAEAEAEAILAKKNTAEALAADIAAIQARTRAELDNVNLTKGERNKIQAQEQKDIEAANRNYSIQQIQDQIALSKARLDTIDQGGTEELKLRIDIINKTAQAELLQEGVTANKKLQIQEDAAKAIRDLTDKFNSENAKAEIETKIAGIETQIAAVQTGSVKELELREQLLDQKAKLEVKSASDQIKNEEALSAKILTIYANTQDAKAKLEEEFETKDLAKRLKDIQSSTDLKNIGLEQTANDPFSTFNEKQNATRQILTNNLKDLQLQKSILDSLKANGDTNIKNLDEQIAGLGKSIAKVKADLKTFDDKSIKIFFDELGADFAAAGSALNSFSQSIATLSPLLAGLFSNLGELSKFASDFSKAAASGFTNIAADIGAGADIINFALTAFSKQKQSIIDSRNAVNAFYAAIATGEENTREAQRQTARQKADQQAKSYQDLRNEQSLLKDQQDKNSQEFQDVLTKLQNESFVSGEHTQKQSFWQDGLAAQTKLVQDFASLAGKSYADLLDLYNNGQLIGNAKALFERLQSLQAEGISIQDSLQSLQDKLNSVLTGTTADTLAKSIADGLNQGKKSVIDFANDFNTLIRQALLSAFTANQIQPAIADFYKQFAALSATSNGVLTKDQIDQLRATYNADLNSFLNKVKLIQQISGQNINGSIGNSPSNLAGAITGISEQTAEILSGQLGGLRFTAINQLTVANAQLATQNSIAANTSLTGSNIQKLLDKFDRYETGAKKIAVQ